MNAQTLTCKSCGAPIECGEGEETAVCDYCGTVNRPAQSAQPEQPTVAAPSGGVGIRERAEALLKRAYLFLEDTDPTRARHYFEKVLDLNPEEYRAYLGCLMIELSVKEEKDISSRDADLGRSDNYRNAYRFAPEEKRAVLDGYRRVMEDRLRERARAEEEAAREKAAEEERLRRAAAAKDEQREFYLRIVSDILIAGCVLIVIVHFFISF